MYGLCRKSILPRCYRGGRLLTSGSQLRRRGQAQWNISLYSRRCIHSQSEPPRSSSTASDSGDEVSTATSSASSEAQMWNGMRVKMPWVDALIEKRMEDEWKGKSGEKGGGGEEGRNGPDMRPKRMRDSFFKGVGLSFLCLRWWIEC